MMKNKLGIDHEVLRISQAQDSSRLFNPTNEKEERDRAFADPGYNPGFIYGNIPPGFESLHQDINSLDIGSVIRAREGEFDRLRAEDREWLAGRYEAKQVMLRGLVDMAVGARDGDLELFEKSAMFVHGAPSRETLNYAERTAREIISEGLERAARDKEMTLEQALSVAENRIEGYGIGGWHVLPDSNVSADASIHAVQRRFRIKAGSMFSPNFTWVIEYHEVDGHLLRAENGWSQPSILFVAYMPNCPHSEDSAVFIEEALAIENEERALDGDRSRLLNHCLRALAVNQASREGFSQVYNTLRESIGKAYGLKTDDGFVKWGAWKIARRVKAGLRDTGRPGGRKYPHSYLTGRLSLGRYKESGGDLKPLYVGRIGLNDLPHVESVLDSGFLKAPRYLPGWLQ